MLPTIVRFQRVVEPQCGTSRSLDTRDNHLTRNIARNIAPCVDVYILMLKFY